MLAIGSCWMPSENAARCRRSTKRLSRAIFPRVHASPTEQPSVSLPDNGEIADIDLEYAKQQGEKVCLISHDGVFCTIELGMTLEEVEAKLATAGIQLKRGSFIEDSYDNSLYGNEYQYNLGFGNKKINDEWILRSIGISSSIVETGAGLRVGDLEEKV